MLVAEEQGRQGAQGDALGLRHLVGDGGQVLAAQPLDFAGREPVGVAVVEVQPRVAEAGGLDLQPKPVDRRGRENRAA